MKTIFKRAAAWLMAVMMIVNCIPVYAQDSATDYSGQEISLADLMTTATDDVTVTFRIDNANYTQDPGSGETHITATAPIEGGDLTYTSWASRYKVTGTGVVCSYTIPAGTSLSDNGLSFPALSVENIGTGNTYSYTSPVNWLTEGQMICSADTVFDEDATLYLRLFESAGEKYTLAFVCSEGTHTIKTTGGYVLSGESVSQAYIDAATEAAYAFTSQYCTDCQIADRQLQKWQLKVTEGGEMVDLEAGTKLTADYAVDNTIKAYAVWGEDTSTPVTAKFQYITKDENGADVINVIEERSLNSGDVLGELPGAPAGAPEGSTFVGWQYTEGDEQKFATPETVITADTVFNAVFTTQVKATFQYTITNAAGEQTTTVVAERFLNPGDTLGTLPSMTAYEHDGRSFVGWQYTDENGSLQYADSNTVITKDTVYTAVFTVKATFQYVYVEEDGTEATKEIAVYKLKPGDALGRLPDMSAYETLFEVFDGWVYTAGEEELTATEETVITEDTIFTAVFAEVECGEIFFHDVLPDGSLRGDVVLSVLMPVGMTLAEVFANIEEFLEDDTSVLDCIWRMSKDVLADMNAVVTAENPIELYTYTYRMVMTLKLGEDDTNAAPGTRALVETETAADGTITMTITAREGEPLTASDFITEDGTDLTRYVWTDENGQTVNLQTLAETGLTESIELTGDGTLTADAQSNPQVRFMLGDNAIYTVALPSGTSLYNWIAANIDTKTSHQIEGNAVRLGAFTWKDADGNPVAEGQTVTEDIDLYGTLNNVTVTFYSDSSKTTQLGNVTLAYGEKVSAGNFPTVDAVQGDKSFVEWRFTGTTGEMRFDEKTAVYEDMDVYAHYAKMHTLTFYTDDSKQTVAGTVNTPDNEPFDTSKYPDVEPPEGQALRYWVVVKGTTAQVFNPQLPVTEDMELYPVFDKYVFVLVDEDTGKKITSIYENAPVNFTVEAPIGYYYVGVELEDGTMIVTDGEKLATTDLFGVTTAEGGQYEVKVTPVFEKKLDVVYHAGEGAMFLTGTNSESVTQTVDASVRLPGELDIVRTDGNVGLVLDGWATTPDATMPTFDVSETVTNAQLKAYDTDADGVVHLYPVWKLDTSAVTVTFVSNYPDGAVDADGNALTEVRYTVYLKSGAKPIMPTLAQAGMAVPNGLNDDDTVDTGRYGLSGWSVMQSGVGDSSGTVNGVYTAESQYQVEVTTDTTFYAAWIDYGLSPTENYVTHFFIRNDGTIPQEPGGYTTDKYYPTSHTALSVTNALRNYINIVNDAAKVTANIQNAPSAQDILDVLPADFKAAYATRAGVELTAENYGTGEGKVWYVQWYACKIANDGQNWTGYYGSWGNFWHVDGRIKINTEYELTYWPNGGTNQYIPPSETHNANDTVTVKYTVTLADGSTNYPQRTGYTFVGWSTNKDTTWQQVEAATDGDTNDGIWKKGSSETLTMPVEDEDLYAIWKPDEKLFTINGYKYLIENNQRTLATSYFNFLIEELDEDGNVINSVTVRNNLRGEIPLEIALDSAGLHTLRISEVKGTDPLMAYDSAVFIITVYVADSENGLYIVGETITRNNVLQTEKKIEFENRYGERDVSVTKVWDDNNDQDGIRPSYIVVDLLRDGTPVGVGQYQTLNAANGWSATWTKLPIADGTRQYVYTVRESSAGAGYTSTTTGDMESGFTITNKHEPLTTEVTVTKQWDDLSNVVGVRPQEINLTLTGSDGSTRTAAVTGTGDSWTYTFTGLPVYHNGGAQITYTVDETDVPAGYTKTVEGYTVTNTLQRDLTFIVNKKIAGNMADPNKEFSFTAEFFAADKTKKIGEQKFALKGGETKTLAGIPYGAYVKVTEDPAGYTAQHVLGTETVNGESYTTEQPITENGWGVTFINTNEVKIDTGVDLDGLPYTLLFLGAAGLGVLWMLLLIARRSRDEE